MIPEYVIQKVLVRGLRLLRQDGRIVDSLFYGLQQSDLNDLRVWFRDTTIDLAINYPDADLKLPAIVLLLKGENESQAFLGNVMQPAGSILETGHPLLRDTDGGVGSTGPLFGGARVFLPPTQAVGGDATEIYLPADAIKLYDPYEEETWAVITSGMGSGQQRRVESIVPGSSNIPTIIAVDTPWDSVPDDTSVVCLQSAQPREGVGEPSKVFSAADLVSRHGALYKARYQLLILGPNQESAIYLYNAVKAIMFINQHFLIQQGFMNLAMTGSDFIPRTEYYPELAYQRALDLEFDYSFDLYLPNEIAESLLYAEDTAGIDRTQLLDRLRVSVTVHDPDVNDVDDVERIASETTLDLT